EVFVLAVASRGEAVMIDDRIPEEARGGAVTLIAGVSVARQVALNLRNLRVAVQPRQDVLPARERLQHRAMIEAGREIEPTLVARIGVEIGHHFVHSPELSVEHLLQLRLVKLGENPFGPGGVLDLYFERRAIARVAVSVAQPRVGLVQHIPWRPETVQIEAG